MGEVEDLVIERNSGQVTYAVVSMGGFLGMGETLFAVPWKSLEPGKEKDTYVLNVDKTKLRSAPHFTKGEWPNLSDSTYGERVHDYYGQTPPWKERTSPSTDPEGKERKRTQ